MPKETTQPRRIILPPTVLLIAILMSMVLHRWLPVVNLWGTGGRGIGIVIIVLALGVNLFCALQFHWRRTTVIPFHESSALITDNIYRYSRNPIYLSMAVLLCGLATALGSLSPWVVPPIFLRIISKVFIEKEEAMLVETFGDDFREYCRRVRRWF